ncbi:inositol monophosphatase family protein [Corynebacterium propinquum]|nr:inositol monophosphatase [Corynebacterium propinquum]
MNTGATQCNSVLASFAEFCQQHREKSADQLREIAIELARLGGAVITRRSEEIGSSTAIARTVETKSSAVDPVTAVDKATEAALVGKLQQLRPADGIVGEEGAGYVGTSGIEWIIDPIDGTVNFLYGIPEYSVSVAAVWNGMPVAGAVYNVERQQMYSAHLGGGATRQDATGEVEPLQANTVTDPSLALVATGFSYEGSRRVRQAEVLTKLLGRVRDIRRMGSAALDLCRVACGQVDVFYEAALNKWDYAAGMLIAAEAGAVVHAPEFATEGSQGEVLVAYAPGLAERMQDELRAAGALEALPSTTDD